MQRFLPLLLITACCVLGQERPVADSASAAPPLPVVAGAVQDSSVLGAGPVASDSVVAGSRSTPPAKHGSDSALQDGTATPQAASAGAAAGGVPSAPVDSMVPSASGIAGIGASPDGIRPSAPVVGMAVTDSAAASQAQRRDSVRQAREESAGAVEWHTVSDSVAPAPSIQDMGKAAAVPDVAGTPQQPQRKSPLPVVPRELEPRVLLWTGVGLAGVGIVAWFLFTSADGKVPQAADLDQATDPTSGNANAMTQKTMTIRWSN
jgi:hypothetical protein